MLRFLSDEELEQRARDLRRKLGLEHQLRIDMMTVTNKLKGANPGFGYARIRDEEMLRPKRSGTRQRTRSAFARVSSAQCSAVSREPA